MQRRTMAAILIGAVIGLGSAISPVKAGFADGLAPGDRRVGESAQAMTGDPPGRGAPGSGDGRTG
ncbi:hypothetical protein GE115_15490 [Agromyces sp. CFH 90414]|uniref:Uncharacterized protein n=1 Tax=Agromyces agglutinans TaxID=2662258 RepID=A0A6I2FKV3_9MICO|nr:hypothetical protein [Agromyces agglutinans]MRG61258.1 hypothetical protein [Agromyces agglutinans]